MAETRAVPLYPAPKRGADDPAPGYWALRSKKTCAWPRGHRLRRTGGTLLNELMKLPLVREPGIRILKGCSGDDFNYTVASRIANITALLAQSVGVVVEPCESCKQNRGMFTSCIIVPALRHLMPCCANCYFNGLGDRCSFHQQGFPETAQTENQNIQSEVPQAENLPVKPKPTQEQIEERREMLLQLNEELEVAVEARDKSEIAVKDAEVELLSARVALQEGNAQIDKILISKEAILAEWEEEMG